MEQKITVNQINRPTLTKDELESINTRLGDLVEVWPADEEAWMDCMALSLAEPEQSTNDTAEANPQ